MPLVFAAISPHPPLILPSVGPEKDRSTVKSTINALENLGKELEKLNPDIIIISSPHPDWGFNVPLFFLAENFKGEIVPHLMGLEPPDYYFEKGKDFFANEIEKNKKYAIIASGDLSHRLREDGPYGFHQDGPKFDKELVESLQKKDIESILNSDNKYPEAGECGLRSFCFLLGVLEASGIKWQTEILSYEGPFGVGYLTARFKL